VTSPSEHFLISSVCRVGTDRVLLDRTARCVWNRSFHGLLRRRAKTASRNNMGKGWPQICNSHQNSHQLKTKKATSRVASAN
jgi:hypothetical protein